MSINEWKDCSPLDLHFAASPLSADELKYEYYSTEPMPIFTSSLKWCYFWKAFAVGMILALGYVLGNIVPVFHP
jgi:hypothetical protein